MRLIFFIVSVFFGYLAAEVYCFPPPHPCDLIPPWYERISIDGAILYGKIDGEGFQYAEKIVQSPPHIKKHFKNISMSWAPGYRVGFDWLFPCQDWQFGFHWTHYEARSSSTSHFHGKANKDVFIAIPLMSNFLQFIPANATVPVRGRLKSRFEFYDLDFSRWSNCSNELYFRPIVGVRIATIHENMKVVSFLGPEFPTFSLDLHLKNEHKGIGFKAGLDSQYFICDSFSVTGGITGALIWGNAEYKNKSVALITALGGFRERLDEHVRVIRPILDLHAGFEWCCIVCDCNPLRIKAEWEFHCLFKQFRYFVTSIPLNAVLGPKTNNNVVLQGVSLTASFEF